jgi:hypothetical protein
VAGFFTRFGGAEWDGTVPPDLVARYDIPFTSAQQKIEATANVGSRVFSFQDNGAGNVLYDWVRVSDNGDTTDTDQLLLFRGSNIVDSSNFVVLWNRASGAAGTETGYRLGLQTFTSDVMQLYSFAAGTPTLVDSIAIAEPQVATYYWLQFRNIGTSLKGRWWEYGTAPPAWQIDTTDGTHTAAGWTGFGSRSDSLLDCDYYYVATDGDDPKLPTEVYGAVTPSTNNTLVAYPSSIQTDGSSFLVYIGEPNKAVDWALTGDGTLTPITDQTDASGKAWAKYTPGSIGTKTIDVTVGV